MPLALLGASAAVAVAAPSEAPGVLAAAVVMGAVLSEAQVELVVGAVPVPQRVKAAPAQSFFTGRRATSHEVRLG